MIKDEIKSVEVVDFDEIDVLEKKCFEYPFPKTIYINDFINNRFSKYFKLIYKQRIIGFFALWVIFEDAQLITFQVDPDYQGLGFANKMLSYIIGYLKDQSCENITLEVSVTNDKAINLYQKFNFEKLTIRKRYYENGDDAFLMKLDLRQ